MHPWNQRRNSITRLKLNAIIVKEGILIRSLLKPEKKLDYEIETDRQIQSVSQSMVLWTWNQRRNSITRLKQELERRVFQVAAYQQTWNQRRNSITRLKRQITRINDIFRNRQLFHLKPEKKLDYEIET